MGSGVNVVAHIVVGVLEHTVTPVCDHVSRILGWHDDVIDDRIRRQLRVAGGRQSRAGVKPSAEVAQVLLAAVAPKNLPYVPTAYETGHAFPLDVVRSRQPGP